MSSGPFTLPSVATRHMSLREGVLCRLVLVAILVMLTHQFGWAWLRFVTSEAVLRISALLGMVPERESIDTIRVQGDLFRFVISCTFVDVFMGMIPLVWNLKESILRNLLMLTVLAVSLFCFNVLRLEVTQLLLAWGVSWIIAHDILGGIAYFVVWLFASRYLDFTQLIGQHGWVSPGH